MTKKLNNKILFTKEYARDNCFLIQEIWFKGFLFNFDNQPNPCLPVFTFFCNQGIVEIWKNESSLNWFLESLYLKNKKYKLFFPQSMKKYQLILKKLANYWRQDYLPSLIELQKFIELMSLGTKYFIIHYYSASNECSSSAIKKAALKIRAVDNFYDNCDRLLRATINHLYPKISIDLALTLTVSELDNPPTIEGLRKRSKNCVFIPDQFLRTTTLENFAAKNTKYSFIFNKVNKNSKTISGNVAFRGQVQGQIRIIKNKSQMFKFKAGEVLVAPMTTPFFVPIMRQASAIITDEGGIGCHAAILARELRIPCIIGTKIATSILKDGDLVWVNANKGIIRKLS